MLTYDYIADFAPTTDIAIPGTVHKLATTALDIAVKVQHADGSLIPYFLGWTSWVNPTTYDVTVRLMSNRHRVTVLLTRQADAC